MILELLLFSPEQVFLYAALVLTHLVYQLTQFISNYDFSCGFRGFTHAGRVAAAYTEAVRFTLRQVKQGKARRFDWDTSVHPLPGVSARNTLQLTKNQRNVRD